MDRRLASVIDHTCLRPEASARDIERLCGEARRFGFFAACVNPVYVSLAARLLRGSGVRVCATAGFPLGAGLSETKALEARRAVEQGADEVDMVMDIGALKSGDDARVAKDIRVVRAATRGKILKVILETALLNRREKVRACLLARRAGADFVKTSTGFGPGGATAADVALLRDTVGGRLGVKAAGGIRDRRTALALLRAGATRLGTSASLAVCGAPDPGRPAGRTIGSN